MSPPAGAESTPTAGEMSSADASGRSVEELAPAQAHGSKDDQESAAATEASSERALQCSRDELPLRQSQSEVTRLRQMAAKEARSFRVSLRNCLKEPLKLASREIVKGEWIVEPPSLIEPGDAVEFGALPSGLFSTPQARASYSLESLGSSVALNLGWTISLINGNDFTKQVEVHTPFQPQHPSLAQSSPT